ncbi:MAG: translocation/assembly module TamB [Holosporaceae bacterium]|nr:translocation/assembly module TamB [Holosporaceae bacterium]
MKKNIKKIFSIVFKIFAMIFLVFGLGVGMLFWEKSRNVIIDAVGQYLETKGIVFRIEGLNGNVTNIQKILVKYSGMELILENISLTRKHFLARSSIYVDKFVLGKIAEQNEAPPNPNDFMLPLKILRFFAADLAFGKGILNGTEGTCILENLCYVPEEKIDKLYGKINREFEVEIALFWNESVCENSQIKFKNLRGFDGVLELRDLAKDITNYKLAVANSFMKIKSDGSYRDLSGNIKINNTFVEYQNKCFNVGGNLYLASRRADLNTTIILQEWIGDLPEKINQNFENISAIINAKCDFNRGLVVQANVFFQKFADVVGQLMGRFQNETLNVSGDVGWIDIWGFKPKRLQCKIDKFSEISLQINGDDFDLLADAKIADKILVKNIKLMAKNSGYISSLDNFIISPESVYSFEFNFSRLEFWNKILPISGDCVGSFSHKNGQLLAVKCCGKRLVFTRPLPNGIFLAKTGKNAAQDRSLLPAQVDQVDGEKNPLANGLSSGYYLSNYDASMAGEKIHIQSRNANLYGMDFHDLLLDLKGEQLQLSATAANNDFFFYAAGKCNRSTQQISFGKCFIKSPQILCNFDVCDLNFLQDIYKISCHLLNAKNISMGHADIFCNGRNIDVNIASFQTNWIHALAKNIPICTLNGSLKLIRDNGIIVGNGSASILLHPKNSIDVKLSAVKTGLDLKTTMNYKNENVRLDVFLPIIFRTDGTFRKNDRDPGFRCDLFANTNLENFLELTDKIDVRGTLNCDLHITGSMINPVICGSATLKKARFIIGDVTLRNGTISLLGNGDNSLVLNGNFLDSQKQKSTAKGKVFLENSCSALRTDLDLYFAKYRLFDSDDMQICVVGNGKMTGNLENLLISGSIDVPECRIQKLDTASPPNNDDIIIENKIRVVNKTASATAMEKDFLTYDIKMHCPKIVFTGKVFEMVLAGDLQLLTYNNKATMEGLLKMKKGRLDLFGKRMKITEGLAEFFREFPFDPKAKFKCNNTFGDLAVYLEINNQPGEGVTFDLYSLPNYSKDTILSNILFGKDLKYLNISEAAQLAHALASFNSRGYIFSILNTFQNIGIIDTLSFSTSERKIHSLNTDKSSQSESDMSISAGKYLHDNLYISINKTSEETFFDIDLSVTPKMSLKANTNGEVGISWKYRY